MDPRCVSTMHRTGTGKSRSHRTSMRDNSCGGAIESDPSKIITESPEPQGRHQIQMAVYSSRQPKGLPSRPWPCLVCLIRGR
jgi:hypothetical protein